MSFASEVKKEISNIQGDDCCLKAELYSIIKYRSTIKISTGNFKIEIITTMNAIARRIVYLFKKLYSIKLDIILLEKKKLDYKSLYVLTTTEKGLDILNDLDLLDESYRLKETTSKRLIAKPCCQLSVLRGAFMMRGSINDPSKSNYHLEIVAMNQNDADFLIEVMLQVGIIAKSIVRSKGIVVYLKKAEQIADFLRFVGATNSLFRFEDERIRRDYSNYANRTINCDIANEEKAITTAAKQLKDIAYLEKNFGLLNLSDRLTDAILLRNANPDDSLSQLSEKSESLIGRYFSKSGLSHCFKDIERMCQQIKKDKDESLS